MKYAQWPLQKDLMYKVQEPEKFEVLKLKTLQWYDGNWIWSLRMTLTDGSQSKASVDFFESDCPQHSYTFKDNEEIRKVKIMMDDTSKWGLCGLIFVNDKGIEVVNIKGSLKGKWQTIDLEQGEQIVGFSYAACNKYNFMRGFGLITSKYTC